MLLKHYTKKNMAFAADKIGTVWQTVTVTVPRAALPKHASTVPVARHAKHGNGLLKVFSDKIICGSAPGMFEARFLRTYVCLETVGRQHMYDYYTMSSRLKVLQAPPPARAPCLCRAMVERSTKCYRKQCGPPRYGHNACFAATLYSPE